HHKRHQRNQRPRHSRSPSTADIDKANRRYETRGWRRKSQYVALWGNLEPGREQTLNDGGLTRDAQVGAQAGAQASIETLEIDPNTPLFRVRSFGLLFITRVASTTAFQMIS